MGLPAISRESVSNEAMFILKSIKENARLGRSNKLVDVKTALEPGVTLEFDSYFFFLRKFHYIAMDREAQLKLTDQGERVVDGDNVDKFTDEIAEFFADQLTMAEEATHAAIDMASIAPPPPVPATDLLLEDDMAPPPPPPPPPPPVAPPGRRGGRVHPEEPVLTQVGGHPESRREAAAASLPLSTSGSPPVGSSKGTDIDLRYVKFDPIGSGPLGTVFKGRHNALGLDICVKELKDIFGYFSFLQRGEVIKRLKKELCAQSQVRHPSVLQVLDQNTDVARPYFVMELCKGSLRERLDQAGGKGLPINQAVRYFLQLSYGLKSAHALGLTHHNIKPENVLFDAYGNVKLGDFGLSRVIEVDQSKGMPQVFVGTGGMGYMSPELISRARDSGPTADVYSLGILLYEMLTGQIPGRRSPMPSEVNTESPTKLDPVFDKMTQDRRENRYPDIDAMLADFYGAFSDGEYLAKGDLILWSEPPRT